MAQLMPLPLTVSCFSDIQTGFTFLVPANPGSPGQGVAKRACVCVCVLSGGGDCGGLDVAGGHESRAVSSDVMARMSSASQ